MALIGGHQKEVLRLQDCEVGWKVVSLSSTRGKPFEAILSWSSGEQDTAHLTITSAARVCLLARTIDISAKSLGGLVVVACLVKRCEAWFESRTIYEAVGESDGENPLVVPVVEWCSHAHISVADRRLLSDTVIDLLDADGNIMSQFGGSVLPPLGIPLGSARELRITTETATKVRVVFPILL